MNSSSPRLKATILASIGYLCVIGGNVEAKSVVEVEFDDEISCMVEDHPAKLVTDQRAGDVDRQCSLNIRHKDNDETDAVAQALARGTVKRSSDAKSADSDVSVEIAVGAAAKGGVFVNHAPIFGGTSERHSAASSKIISRVFFRGVDDPELFVARVTAGKISSPNVTFAISGNYVGNPSDITMEGTVQVSGAFITDPATTVTAAAHSGSDQRGKGSSAANESLAFDVQALDPTNCDKPTPQFLTPAANIFDEAANVICLSLNGSWEMRGMEIYPYLLRLRELAQASHLPIVTSLAARRLSRYWRDISPQVSELACEADANKMVGNLLVTGPESLASLLEEQLNNSNADAARLGNIRDIVKQLRSDTSVGNDSSGPETKNDIEVLSDVFDEPSVLSTEPGKIAFLEVLILGKTAKVESDIIGREAALFGAESAKAPVCGH